MEKEKFNHPHYMGVWWWLLGLTMIEIGLAYLPINKAVVATLIVIFAIAKALLVAAYFMHLKFERLLLIAVIVYPIALSVTLTILSMFDFTGSKGIGS